MTPLFSCVIPVKGKRPYFDAALESLTSQGLGEELEIIVQDADVEPDAGQSDALNRGFRKARGEWLFWLNADDLLMPGALKKVREVISSSSSASSRKDDDSSSEGRGERVEWIAGNELWIDAEGRTVGKSVGCGWHDWLFRHSVPHVNGPSAFFRRGLLEKVGGFDVSLCFCMDWDLWIRFMQAGAKYERINEFLWAQRRWSGSKTQRKIVGEELAKHRAEIARMLKKNGFVVTGFGNALVRSWRMLCGCYLRERL